MESLGSSSTLTHIRTRTHIDWTEPLLNDPRHPFIPGSGQFADTQQNYTYVIITGY